MQSQRFSNNTDLRTDVPVSNDPKDFAPCLEASGACFSPFAFMKTAILIRCFSEKKNNFSDHKFSNRPCIRKRRIENSDSTVSAVFHINLVCADAKCADGQQFVSFRENIR